MPVLFARCHYGYLHWETISVREEEKDAKEKSQKYLTNAAVNAVATGEVFRPVKETERSRNISVVRKTPDGRFHCAVFNHSTRNRQPCFR